MPDNNDGTSSVSASKGFKIKYWHKPEINTSANMTKKTMLDLVSCIYIVIHYINLGSQGFQKVFHCFVFLHCKRSCKCILRFL